MELLVVIAIFVTMLAVLAPLVQLVRDRAHKINCANNLRNISLGIHMYAADHSETFPPDLKTLYPAYVEDEKVFRCPAATAIGNVESPGYLFTAGMTESSSPKEVIVRDRDENHRGTGCNVLRINGTVEWVKNSAKKDR